MSTLVVYSDTTDGFLFSEDSFGTGYSAARDGTGNAGITTDTGSNLRTGQNRVGGATYDVWEAFIAFDTSSLTAGATVSAAVLNLTAQSDNSTTDFTVEARLRDWGTSVDTGDWVAGGGLSALTLLAHYATSGGFVPDTAYDLVNDTFPANVNKTGSTRLILSSSRTTGNNGPTGSEYVTARSADQTGTTQDPKLTVTYSAGEVYDGPGPTLDAVIQKAGIAGSFTANAVLKRTQTPTLTADAALKKTITSTLTADAVLRREQAGSLTADAAFAVLRTGSFTANAVIKAAVPGSVTGDAIRLRTFHFGQGVW